MYIKYIQIFRRLEQAYDQVVHPQKRRVLRHVLDGVMGRVLELKNEMVNLELCEYHYFDDVLSDLKLTPVSPANSNKETGFLFRGYHTAVFISARISSPIVSNCPHHSQG